MTKTLRGMMCALAVAGGAAGCGEAGLDGTDVEVVTSALTVSDLALVNGWALPTTPVPYPHNGPATPGVTLNGDVVQLRGGMTGGTSSLAFTLPSAYRPTGTVYLPVSLCNAAKGRLVINTAGQAYVYTEKSFANAQCLTSLDGLSYARSTAGYTTLALQNGWTTTPYGTRAPAIKYLGGDARLVRLAGAMQTSGTNASPFVIPAGMRPSADVYLPVDLCNATKGRLRITPAGAVTVAAEGGAFANAACFTSLDGVTYSTTPAAPGAFECLDAVNGWTMGPYSTRGLCLVNDGGIVRLMGGLSTTGTNSYITTFSTKFWPSHDISVEVDLCNGEQGRILMHQFGGLSVEAEHGFGQAACFTSLEGVSFVR